MAWRSLENSIFKNLNINRDIFTALFTFCLYSTALLNMNHSVGLLKVSYLLILKRLLEEILIIFLSGIVLCYYNKTEHKVEVCYKHQSLANNHHHHQVHQHFHHNIKGRCQGQYQVHPNGETNLSHCDVMFGMLGYYPSPEANNVWTPWVKHMMNHEGVQQVAMVKHEKKLTVSCSKKFVLPSSDIQSIWNAMDDKTVDKVRIKDKVYTLLPRSFTSDPSMLVGQNADKYIVIGTSNTMYIVVQIKKAKPPSSGQRGCPTPDRVRSTLDMIKKIVTRLVNNDY